MGIFCGGSHSWTLPQIHLVSGFTPLSVEEASEMKQFCSQRFISSSDCAATLKVKVLPARKIKKTFFIYRINNFRSYLWQRTYPKIGVLKAAVLLATESPYRKRR
jgi:hypothetical protein